MTINADVEIDKHSIPETLDTIKNMEDCKLQAKLQFKVTPESRKMLTIVTNKGLFQYVTIYKFITIEKKKQWKDVHGRF